MQTRVRTVIQDRESNLYFKMPGEWTAEIGEATDFKQMLVALDSAQQTGRQTLDILMTFGEPKYDVRIAAPCKTVG